MADLSGGVPPAVSRPPVVWVAGINGVVSGMTSNALAASIQQGINQAFYQSPYIFRVNP
jgi:folylpolyglutamate synthase/dihydropteroate synthase